MKKSKPSYTLTSSENSVMCARQRIEDDLMAAYDHFLDKVNTGEIITAQDITNLKLDRPGVLKLSDFLKARNLE